MTEEILDPPTVAPERLLEEVVGTLEEVELPGHAEIIQAYELILKNHRPSLVALADACVRTLVDARGQCAPDLVVHFFDALSMAFRQVATTLEARYADVSEESSPPGATAAAEIAGVSAESRSPCGSDAEFVEDPPPAKRFVLGALAEHTLERAFGVPEELREAYRQIRDRELRTLDRIAHTAVDLQVGAEDNAVSEEHVARHFEALAAVFSELSRRMRSGSWDASP